MPEVFERDPNVDCFRSLPRPVSGGGPATVSSQSWSSKLMVHVSKRGAQVKKWVRRLRGSWSGSWSEIWEVNGRQIFKDKDVGV